VGELQEEQLAIHQQATAEAAANAKVTFESLIAEAEAARVKAMAEKGGAAGGGAAAAVSALTAKAKLAGMWRDKVDQHNTGSAAYERIERIIIERPSAEERLLPAIEAEPDFEEQPATSNPSKHWSL
jgi:hypothetical protein